MQTKDVIAQLDGRESKDLEVLMKAHSKMSNFQKIEPPTCSLVDDNINEGMASLAVGSASGMFGLILSLEGADWIYCVAFFATLVLGISNTIYVYCKKDTSPSVFARLKILLTRKSNNPKSSYRRIEKYKKDMDAYRKNLKARKKSYEKLLRKVQPILDRLNKEIFDKDFYFDTYRVQSKPRQKMQGMSDVIGVLKQKQSHKQLETSSSADQIVS